MRRIAQMSQPEKQQPKTVKTPAEKQRQEETGREDPAEPDDVGTAKETTTVRGHDEPQAVRHSR
jgi:hypothetical protein